MHLKVTWFVGYILVHIIRKQIGILQTQLEVYGSTCDGRLNPLARLLSLFGVQNSKGEKSKEWVVFLDLRTCRLERHVLHSSSREKRESLENRSDGGSTACMESTRHDGQQIPCQSMSRKRLLLPLLSFHPRHLMLQ